MMIELDYSLLPQINSGRTFAQIEKSLLLRLSVLPETAARAESAAHFFALRPDFKWSELYHDKSSQLQTESFIRASLAEIVSMEDTLPRDLKRNNIVHPAIKLNSSKNPMLHIVRELRNLELHVRTSKTNTFDKDVLIGTDEYPANISCSFIEGFNIEALSGLRNAKKYQRDDLIKMTEWFDGTQMKFGVHEIIFRSIEAFISEVIEAYKL